MRSVLYKLIIAASLVACLLSIASCLKDSCNNVYIYKLFTPVYKSLDELRGAVKREAPRNIEEPGKIYLYGNYIFLNEVNKGVHVIDNSNPSAPNKVAFINIPGNLDIAIKGNILYADSYIDLVALDISNPQNVRETKRFEYAFPHRQYEYGIRIDTASDRVIVDFIAKDTVVKRSCDPLISPTSIAYEYFSGPNTSLVQANSAKSTSAMALGVSGSMARFTLVGNYLYLIDNYFLQTYDVSNPLELARKATVPVGSDIETIFPYKNSLFIGARSGMFIYDASNPAQPVRKGTFTHARRCDPVVVQDDIAYVTLRGTGECGGTTNQLDVLDVKNLEAPRLIRSYPMSGPYGLGIQGSKLFVCEGEFGLRFMDAQNAADIVTRKIVGDVNAYDVIPNNNILLVTAKDGLYQYDHSNLQAPKLLSKVPITVKQ
ncbi:MAG TPA: hypothetical protein VGD35_22370 [Chitinophaga sp.]